MRIIRHKIANIQTLLNISAIKFPSSDNLNLILNYLQFLAKILFYSCNFILPNTDKLSIPKTWSYTNTV